MVTFEALGGLTVSEGGESLNIGGPRQRRLLAILLINRNAVVSVDRLAEAVFDGQPTAAAATTLRSYIARVRRVVDTDGGAPRVLTQPPGYMLRVADDAFDVARFEVMLTKARHVVVADSAGAAALIRQALGLWRGDPYVEFADEGWARPEASRLEELQLSAFEMLFEIELGTGTARELIAEIEPLASAHPLRERLQAQLMLALYLAGRQVDALRAFEAHRSALAEDIGVAPAPELQELERRMLAHDPTLREAHSGGRAVRGYRLDARLGTGRDGAVFSARLQGIERELAIKVFRSEIADEPAFVHAFVATAQLVAALRHPAVVPIQDYWREPGAAYTVTPRLYGGTLAERLGRRAMTEAEGAVLVRRIGGALAAAHTAGVAHGRVSAANVLFDDSGQPCLADFAVGQLDPAPSVARDLVDLATLVGEAIPSGRAAIELALTRVMTGDDQTVGVLTSSLLDVLEAPTIDVACAAANPYKGLLAFDESDAADYFGRSNVVDEIVARLGSDGLVSRLVLVVGGSGTGKSSLVRAGVIPRVRRDQPVGSASWSVATMLPGATPLKELAGALRALATGDSASIVEDLGKRADSLDRVLRVVLPDRGQLLLVVDQFEELFTLADDNEQRRFLDQLAHAVTVNDSRLHVLATLRADYYDRPLGVHPFGALVNAATVTIAAMSPADIEAAIVEPAERVGRHVERPLVAELVAAVVDQSAALPALQFTLWELADACPVELTMHAYRVRGGISGAISARAEQLYHGLDEVERSGVRSLFERLVSVAPDSEPTRRAAQRTEFGEGGLDELIDRFAAARLLSLDRHPQSRVPTVEVAHEALLREWPRLRRWIDDDRDALLVLGNLRQAASGWIELHRDPGALYRGARLQVALDVAAVRVGSIPSVEQEFLDASREARDAETHEAEASSIRQARNNRRLRVQLVVIACALVIALIGGFVAVDQRRGAERERRVATARELAAASTGSIEEDPELAMLLAIEAIDTTRSHGEEALPEAAEALHRAVSSSRLMLDVPQVGGAIDWSADGTMFVTEGQEESGIVDIRDAQTGASLHAFKGHAIDVNDVAFNADGSMLATAGDDGALRIWNPVTGAPVREFVPDDEMPVWGPSFSPDGLRVAALWYEPEEARLRIFDVTTGDLVGEHLAGGAITTSFSADGSMIAFGQNGEDVADVIDVETGAARYTVGAGQLWIKDVAFSPDGRWLATAGGDATARLWDASTGEPGPTINASTGPLNALDWNADGTQLAMAGQDGTAKVIGLVEGGWTELASVSARSMSNGVAGVAFSPDGQRIMTGDVAIDSVKIWDVSPTGGGELLNLTSVPLSPGPVVVGPMGEIYASTPGGAVTAWDSEGALLTRFGPPPGEHEEVTQIALSPDGTRLATSTGPLPVWIWDTATGDQVGVIEIEGDPYLFGGVAWSPDSQHLALGLALEAFGEIDVYDRTGRPLSEIRMDEGVYVRQVRFDATGDRLVAARGSVRDDPALIGFDMWDWRQATRLVTHTGPAALVAVDPSGRLLATGRPLEGVVDVWDIDTVEQVAILRGQTPFEDFTFTDDGTRIATAGSDGTVRMWDPVTGKQELVLRHDTAVSSIAMAPDGQRLVSIDYAGVVRVWTLDLDELVSIAGQRLTRQLADDECRQYLHLARCAD